MNHDDEMTNTTATSALATMELSNLTMSPTMAATEEYVSEEAPPIFKYIQTPSALLSTLGSVLVVCHIYANARRQQRRSSSSMSASAGRHSYNKRQSKSQATFTRLLLGLCLFDIMSSSTYFLEPFVTTFEAGHWSCTASGFCKMTGIAIAAIYNGGISLFSFLMICCQWTDYALIWYFEPFWHTLTTGILLFAIAGIPLQVFNPLGEDGCWAREYPYGCNNEGEEDCERGGFWAPIYGMTGLVGILGVMFVLIVCHTAIFCTVRQQEKRINRFQFDSSCGAQNGRNVNGAFSPQQQQQRQQQQRKHFSKSRKVAHQSILYCAGFFATYFLTVIKGIGTGGEEQWDKTWYVVLAALQEIMFPLQGAFNALMFFRPKYLQWRKIVDTPWKAIKGTLTQDIYEKMDQYRHASRLAASRTRTSLSGPLPSDENQAATFDNDNYNDEQQNRLNEIDTEQARKECLGKMKADFGSVDNQTKSIPERQEDINPIPDDNSLASADSWT